MMNNPVQVEEEATQENRWPDDFGAILIRGLVVLCVLGLAVLIPHVYVRVTEALAHPMLQLDNEEGALLAQAVRVAQGKPLYRELNDYPYLVGTYPPFYLWVAGSLTNLHTPSFFVGRLITALSVFSTGILLFTIVYALTRQIFAALLAPLLFLATFECYNWSAYFRVDLLALALTLSSLALLLGGSEKKWMHIGAACLAALALFTKQTMYSVPVVSLIALWVWDRAAFRRYAVTFVAAAGLPFLALSALTGGQFAVHTIWYNMNRYHWPDLLVWAAHVWRFYRWWLLAGLLAFALLVRELVRSWRPLATIHGTLDAAASSNPVSTAVTSRAEQELLRTRFLLIACVAYQMLSVTNFLSLPKAGSAENYLLEPLAAWSLAVGVAIGYGLRKRTAAQSDSWKAWILLMAFLLALHGVHLHRWSKVIFGEWKRPAPADFEAAARLTSELARASGDVVSEVAAYALFAEKPVLFQPFIMSELTRQGRWDESRFLKDIRAGRFAIFASTTDLFSDAYTDAFTPGMREALRDAYRLDRVIQGGHLWQFFLYKPRASARPALPDTIKER
ncbi:MAG: glycosyltransferase family 39 protein [Candidatus Sumerlaea chitinivorans]|nr:glycosyltransferase family 39 protein [Candidatus Sumerlaea chitinivorans]